MFNTLLRKLTLVLVTCGILRELSVYRGHLLPTGSLLSYLWRGSSKLFRYLCFVDKFLWMTRAPCWTRTRWLLAICGLDSTRARMKNEQRPSKDIGIVCMTAGGAERYCWDRCRPFHGRWKYILPSSVTALPGRLHMIFLAPSSSKSGLVNKELAWDICPL